MINPNALYPLRTNAPDSNYIYGSAKDSVVSGDGIGTEWKAAMWNDITGYFQRLVQSANITPSGSSETVLASDVDSAARVAYMYATDASEYDVEYSSASDQTSKLQTALAAHKMIKISGKCVISSNLDISSDNTLVFTDDGYLDLAGYTGSQIIQLGDTGGFAELGGSVAASFSSHIFRNIPASRTAGIFEGPSSGQEWSAAWFGLAPNTSIDADVVNQVLQMSAACGATMVIPAGNYLGTFGAGQEGAYLKSGGSVFFSDLDLGTDFRTSLPTHMQGYWGVITTARIGNCFIETLELPSTSISGWGHVNTAIAYGTSLSLSDRLHIDKLVNRASTLTLSSTDGESRIDEIMTGTELYLGDALDIGHINATDKVEVLTGATVNVGSIKSKMTVSSAALSLQGTAELHIGSMYANRAVFCEGTSRFVAGEVTTSYPASFDCESVDIRRLKAEEVIIECTDFCNLGACETTTTSASYGVDIKTGNTKIKNLLVDGADSGVRIWGVSNVHISGEIKNCSVTAVNTISASTLLDSFIGPLLVTGATTGSSFYLQANLARCTFQDIYINSGGSTATINFAGTAYSDCVFSGFRIGSSATVGILGSTPTYTRCSFMNCYNAKASDIPALSFEEFNSTGMQL